MLRLAAALIAACWRSLGLPPACAQDPEAPDGAPKHWLANEPWINYLWLPYEEARLYELIGKSRGEVFRWVRDERTIAQLARRQGWDTRKLAQALVAPRRGRSARRCCASSTDRAERTLTQGHLGQHILFHALHQNAVPERATGDLRHARPPGVRQVPPRRAEPAADLRAQRAHAGRGAARRLGRAARRRGARRGRRLAAAARRPR